MHMGCPGSPAIPIEEEYEGLNDVVINDEDDTDDEEPGPEVEADEENQDEGESSGDGGQSDEEVTSG
jgi:hypothetical protein